MKNTIPRAARPASNHPQSAAEPSADFAISYHGTLSLFRPLTDSATDWLRLHCPDDGEHSYFGKALAIEHRFVAGIVRLATDDGLISATGNQGRN
jgi:hypothetical protein